MQANDHSSCMTYSHQLTQYLGWQPGPGQYDIKSGPSGPAWSIKGRHPQKTEVNDISPASYSPKRDSGPTPIYLHGRTGRVLEPTADYPSPNAYSIPQRDHGYAFSLSGRHNVAINDTSPGPGAYDISERQRGGITMSGRYPLRATTMSPGPADYSPMDPRRNAQAGFTMRGRPASARTSDNPGPGAYDVSKSMKGYDSRGATLSGRHTTFVPDQYPGPGAYNLSRQPGADSPAHTFGNGRSPRRRVEQTPGPGAYSPKRPETAPAISLSGWNRN